MRDNSPAEIAASAAALRDRLATVDDPVGLLQALFTSAPVGLQIFAPDGRCVVVNQAFIELFGGGAPPPDYNIFEDTVLVERGVADLVRRGFAGERIVLPPIWYDVRDLRNVAIRDGRRIAVQAEVVPLRGATGEVDHVLFVFHDLTATHQAREQAEAAAAAAEEARAQAEAANRAKDEFLAMLGHELRNPLAPIVTALDLTRSREGPSRERAIIERQVDHLRRLVDDLLDVARITRGKLELEQRPLELAVPVHEGIDQARPLIEQRRHRLEVDVPPEVVVLGDRVRLAQIVANLMTNAARYTEPGGTITVSAERRGPDIHLRVLDTGIGMSAELVPRVFEVFAQGARSIDRGSGGLGLGLAIVKSLTELHGGRVYARSDGAGCGSEFEIVLAALDTAATAHPDDLPAPGTERRAGRILIVDDNADAAELLALSLEASGYDVAVTYDPHDALVAAQARVPDLALIDIGLPGMTGYELAHRFRADPALSAVRLVAVTGYGQPSDRERSHDAGFLHHFIKPVGLDELRRIIATLIA